MITHKSKQTATISYKINKESGFTLVEMLVVLVIIGLIAGLVGPRVLNYVNEARIKTTKIEIENISSAIDLFSIDVGRYPTSNEGLEALIKQPSGVDVWNGPYLKVKGGNLPKDPWNHDYIYRCPGEHGPYDLYSFGSDGREGGTGSAADITNWQR